MASETDPTGPETTETVKKRRKAGAEAAASKAPKAVERDVPQPGRLNILVFSLLAFCLIAFGLWLVSAGKAYREEHAQATGSWRVGTTRTVELTLVKEDKRNLGCASDQTIAGLRCGYRSDGRRGDSGSTEGPEILQPYNTVGNELLLGAGLWRSPDFKGALPQERFVTLCKYNIKGLLQSASTRYDVTAAFSPVGKTVTVGTLTDCVIPR